MAVFFLLMTVSPAIYAMQQVEERPGHRLVFVQQDAHRKRRRAIGRYYGIAFLPTHYALHPQ